jgi:hypothetical protein
MKLEKILDKLGSLEIIARLSILLLQKSGTIKN